MAAYEPPFEPLTSEKIRVTVGRIILMTTEQIVLYRKSIIQNVHTMYLLGGYHPLHVEEHTEWVNMLGKVLMSIYNEQQIDWDYIETRLLINSCIRRLTLTDQSYQEPILKELDAIDANWMHHTDGNFSQSWPALLNA